MDDDNPILRGYIPKGINMTAIEVQERMRQAEQNFSMRKIVLQKWQQDIMEEIMGGIQKKDEGEQEKQELPSADLGYEIPDTSGLTKRLEDARIVNLQREHQAEEEEDEKDEKQGGERRKKRPKKTVGQICFCMNPSCRIGEFIEVEKEDVE